MKDEWSNNGYKGLKFLEDTASINDYVKTDRYVGGIFDGQWSLALNEVSAWSCRSS